MANKQWGIWVEGTRDEEGVWMSDGHWKDDNGDWHDIPAVYETPCEAHADAREFSKGSKHKYSAKKFKETP